MVNHNIPSKESLVFNNESMNGDNTLSKETCPTLRQEYLTSNGNAFHEMQQGEFNWNEAEQGIILGSFFYGYVITQCKIQYG